MGWSQIAASTANLLSSPASMTAAVTRYLVHFPRAWAEFRKSVWGIDFELFQAEKPVERDEDHVKGPSIPRPKLWSR